MKRQIPSVFFMVVVIFITALFFGLIGGFALAVFWAVVFAILFHPLYQNILKRFPTMPNLSAGISLLIVLLVVIIPLAVISAAVINEATVAYDTILNAENRIQDQIFNIQKRLPLEGGFLESIGLGADNIQTKLQDIITEGTQLIAGKAVGLTQNLFGFFVSFFLMLYMLFFFLRDGQQLVREFVRVVPIEANTLTVLLQRFEIVVRATVKGSLLVALIQGIAGGLLLWALGIRAAFLWGVLMVLGALLPVGAILVWGPWALVLLVQGNYTKGIILIAVGTTFIGLIDNFLRPRLVGQDTRLPDYLVLITTLGGLAWLGLSGFVIGPVIGALFITCWQIMGDKYGHSPIQVERIADTVISDTDETAAIPPTSEPPPTKSPDEISDAS